ncbi:hypothetical protein RQM59_02580 [Flavobacteriaceae bacterium S356]|uniref:Lipoprotein n=1 Tax=Asprobacillus argus TaxID=3076534 RepID=A0ABU3LBZ6_9FLAO|nr:hypothetical protein [Flavobacteriaceae bacterium S356]
MKKLLYLVTLVLIISCAKEPEKCESFKLGEFYMFFDGERKSYYKIDRSENEQLELDTRGNKVFYTVEWLSKCSYVLKFDPDKNELIPEMKMINEDGGLVIVLENTPSREKCINYTSYVKDYEESSKRTGMFCKGDD